jgi:hypothetical protein
MVMKTPGVYIVEKNAFPNSVVEVATAVPAFIGHTQKAVSGGKPLAGKPWRIASMDEFHSHFGGAPLARFTVHEVAGPSTVTPAPDMAAAPGQHAAFKLGGKTYRLSRPAGLQGGRFLLHQALRHFFQNGGGPCYIVSVGDYTADTAAGDPQHGLVGGLTALLKEQEPTLVVVPDAVLLPSADCTTVQTAMLKHCGGDMHNRLAILDVWGGDRSHADEARNCIDQFRSGIGNHWLSYGAAYYPWLHTTLAQARDMDTANIANPAELADLIGAEWGLGGATAAATSDDKKVAQKLALLLALREPTATAEERALLHTTLLATSALYALAMDAALGLLNLMPPSAAVAGLYTMVDNTRGVWKAPANISVAGAVKPAVDISHTEQEDLNVTASGKSINALRSFIGEGVLVWGARTLDGNSLDWRYVNVRRTMIMLEESCRLATQAYVFEPPVTSTWVSLKAMLGNFLTGIWKRGGLAGAVPEDAFSVHVGLGDTMTAEDIQQGILRVTVLVAISRPAEFIEITFQQQMLKG